MIEPPRTVEGIELVIWGDSKTVVDWIKGKAKQKVSYRSIETIQIQLMEWWKKGRRLEPKDRRLGGAHLHGTQQVGRLMGGLQCSLAPEGMGRRVCDRWDQSNWDMRILGWELQRQSMWCGHYNFDLHTGAGVGYAVQIMWTCGGLQLSGC